MSEGPLGEVGSPRVVLVVVDSPAHRAAFNKHFEDTPHHLVFAADGEDGFDRFAESKPHLVIAHYNVARLDGTILCQLIRQQPRGKEVPVVLVGEELSQADLSARVAAVGADALLPLPCTVEALMSCVSPLLESGRPPSATPDLQERPVLGTSGQPTELTFGSMLEDFMSQTDEAGPSVEPLAPAPPTEAAAPVPSSPGQDMDTVVSFKNPFFEGDPPTSLEVEPVVAAPVVSVAGEAQIEPPLGTFEPPTPRGHELEPPAARISSDLGRESVTQLSETPAGGSPLVPAPRAVLADSQVVAAAPPHPLIDEPDRPDPLEEPKISGPGSGVRPRPEPGGGKSQLIKEVPREGTPSEDKRVSQVHKRSGGQRRGLDESQLGKRLAKRVRTMHRLLDEVDYYQLLGLERSASPEALKRAYFDLSLEFHPDRFFLLRSGDLKEKIYEIYRRIAEAHLVLADERKRRAYDEARSHSSVKRAAPELRGDSTAPREAEPDPETGFTPVAETDAGMRFVELARAAYERGDDNAARLHLVFAHHHERTNPSLEAAIEHVARRRTASL